MRKPTRREILLSIPLLGIGAALGYGRYVGSKYFEVNSHTISCFERPGPVVRLLHMADFHLSGDNPLEFLAHAIELGIATNPDLICLTGDFIDATLGDEARYIHALRRFSEFAPTFAVAGNHDGGAWAKTVGGYNDSSRIRRILSRAGIGVLHNEHHKVTVRGRNLTLVGVGDLWAKEMDGERAFRGLAPSAHDTVVLLAHNPDMKAPLESFTWDIMLSGHTHGGQLIVPISGETPFAPVADKRYVAGIRPWKDRLVHVTRGVGSCFGMRFNCPPEISVLDLV